MTSVKWHLATKYSTCWTLPDLYEAKWKLWAGIAKLILWQNPHHELCLDLEGRSYKQNLRIEGVMEGKEHGQTTEDFVANLVKGVLDRARHAESLRG